MNYNKVLDTIQDELDFQLSLVARDATLCNRLAEAMYALRQAARRVEALEVSRA